MEVDDIFLQFDEWLKTRVGQLCSNPDILHLSAYDNVLRERLKTAFLAGMEVQAENLAVMQRQIVAEVLKKNG